MMELAQLPFEESTLEQLTRYPFLVFAFTLVMLWLAAQVGVAIQRWQPEIRNDVRDDLSTVLTAALTLLGLIIGFTFSMAVGRYDQRKNYEEEEANAIGTEYLRVDLLPAGEAAKEHELLGRYLDQRILFYTTHDETRFEEINKTTSKLQADLWSTLQAPAMANPSPVMATVVTGMNDVINRQGYTQAAWWNRIPFAAWNLMGIVALGCNFLLGYNARATKGRFRLFFMLPLLVAIAFFLIADVDSPRHGVIRVAPHNLVSLSQSLSTP